MNYFPYYDLDFMECKNIVINVWCAEGEVIGLSPRTGRPKVDNPKSVSIKVHFEEEMDEALIAYAEHSISRTEAIRQGLKLLLSREK